MADQRTYQRVICEVDGNGNGRVVYPRNSGFRICAAGDTCATQVEVRALADDLCGAVDRIEARLSALEVGEVLPADVLEFLRDVAHGTCASADFVRAWSQTSKQASALLRKYAP